VSHRNAPLTPQGRLLLCRRIEAGTPIAHVAAAMAISRRCASKWWHRYLELGADGLHDRSSRPLRSPRRVSEHVEAKICRQRGAEKTGPDRLATHLDVPASTIYRVLRRHDLNRLSHLDRPTAAGFRRRAEAWFRARGIVVERVLSDNGFCYRGKLFNQALAQHHIVHNYCRPYRPQTNGKVERFHRTLLDEWAYVRPYHREADRTRALARWLHRHNHHRVHTAIRDAPITRVTNLPREHT
jgi:transposase InsO family protein